VIDGQDRPWPSSHKKIDKICPANRLMGSRKGRVKFISFELWGGNQMNFNWARKFV
jgi:hypothetical protein